jgi:hypothetical protein
MGIQVGCTARHLSTLILPDPTDHPANSPCCFIFIPILHASLTFLPRLLAGQQILSHVSPTQILRSGTGTCDQSAGDDAASTSPVQFPFPSLFLTGTWPRHRTTTVSRSPKVPWPKLSCICKRIQSICLSAESLQRSGRDVGTIATLIRQARQRSSRCGLVAGLEENPPLPPHHLPQAFPPRLHNMRHESLASPRGLQPDQSQDLTTGALAGLLPHLHRRWLKRGKWYRYPLTRWRYPPPAAAPFLPQPSKGTKKQRTRYPHHIHTRTGF